MDKRPDPFSTSKQNQVIRSPAIGLQALNHVRDKNPVPLILKADPTASFEERLFYVCEMSSILEAWVDQCRGML